MDSHSHPKEYLKLSLEGDVPSVVQTILNAANEISSFLRHSPIFKLETSNDFGDQQLHQDVHCDQIIEKHLRLNPLVKAFASEERPAYTEIAEGEGYVVTFDPLDGSSIVDTNFAIGSIFSIWKTDSRRLLKTKLREQVNAVITIFGPRTTAVFYNESAGKVQEVTSVDDHWIISHDHLTIKEKTNIFSPGNLRSASDNLEYRQAIVGWIDRGMTLRYTGGLVVDVYQIFIKGHGIFSNCGSKNHKCKLRALYEAAALGYLIEKAGGSTITAGKGSLLDFEVQSYDDRLSFAMGSAQEIDYLKHLF